ncbi:phage portal protein, partial [Bacteroides thetaiotaomicron]|uniref:phage portal protein n=1 Tax=Bacteroides thetaiotaomicron TaxID=818 RepID=UPI001F2B5710
MAMTLEDILALEDVDQKIGYLKKGRRTEEPNTYENWKDWNADLHEIIVDKEKYPDIEIVEEKGREEWDDTNGKSITIPPKKRTEPCNRISIPLEQDITNIQTAFTVGTEPKMDCSPSNESEKGLFYAIQQVLKKNKIQYQNKRIVRSWLSEQECAEYWYAVKDDSFWLKFWNKI